MLPSSDGDKGPNLSPLQLHRQHQIHFLFSLTYKSKCLNFPDKSKKECWKVTAEPRTNLAESVCVWNQGLSNGKQVGLIGWWLLQVYWIVLIMGQQTVTLSIGVHQGTSLLSTFFYSQWKEEIMQHVWRWKGWKYSSQKMTNLGRKNAASV